MKFTTLSRRTAAAGAAAALIAGALVGATTTAAQAAPIRNDYMCDGPTADFPLWLDSDVPALASITEIAAGFDVPAGLMDVTNTVTVPTAVINGLAGSGITRVESNDFAGTFGPVVVDVDGVGAQVADAVDNGDGTSSLEANGANAAFEVPAAGTYALVSPTAFTLDAKNEGGTTILRATCTIAANDTVGTYGSLDVVKNESTSKATAVNSPVQKGDVAKVKVKVSALNETPSGKVVLKNAAGKTLDSGMLNAKGVATLKFVAKSLGKNKLTAIYKGDGYTTSSRTNVVVKVVR